VTGPTRRALLGSAAALAFARPALAAGGDLADLEPAVAEMIDERRVPSLSLAVIDGAAIATLAVGRSGRADGEAVTPRTLYQAASISKTAAAATVLAVAQTGVVDLDADVRSYLTRWRLPPSPLLDGGAPVSFRRLLGMTAGIGVPGFAGYGPGEAVPDLVQILDGTPPATSPPVTVVAPPGRQFLYSGGGYEIAEAALEDATRQSFATLFRGLVQAPCDLGDSLMEQPLPGSQAAAAAVGHREDGTPLDGGARTMPELAAAGLWSTPRDLALLLAALSDSWRGTRRPLLDGPRIRAMFAPVDGFSYGLGGAVAGTGEVLTLQKRGQNIGFQSYLALYPATGQGAVMMTNGDRGNEIAAVLMPALAARYGWPAFPGIID